MVKKDDKNLKLYPKYRQLSMDFLFYYTINVLFLTQVKNFEMAQVVLVETFYSLFVILWQIPASTIVKKLGRKKAMICGNLANVIYLVLFILSINFWTLIIAEAFCGLGFALKDIAEPAMLNTSIKSDKKEKSTIFAKIQGKAVSGYYILSAISLILSGFLFKINGYIPVSLCLAIVVITLLMSTRFVDNTREEVENEEKEEKEESISLKEAIKFAFKSGRIRSLLIFSGVFYGILRVVETLEISLLEDLAISSEYIGIMFAVLNLASSLSSRTQETFQKTFKNRTLTTIGLTIVFTIIVSGLTALTSLKLGYIIAILFVLYFLKYMTAGLYNVLEIKYLSNFTNDQIDTHIFAINSFLSCTGSVLFSLYASFLLDRMPTANAMITFGLTMLVVMSITLLYMRKRVGLDPKEYSKEELKFEKKL